MDELKRCPFRPTEIEDAIRELEDAHNSNCYFDFPSDKAIEIALWHMNNFNACADE